ncbi:hypothetical protein VOLCADRAFT_120800, partial [Volvox carteri f. nagariensis]
MGPMVKSKRTLRSSVLIADFHYEIVCLSSNLARHGPRPDPSFCPSPHSSSPPPPSPPSPSPSSSPPPPPPPPSPPAPATVQLVHVAVNLGHAIRPWALCRALSDAAAAVEEGEGEGEAPATKVGHSRCFPFPNCEEQKQKQQQQQQQEEEEGRRPLKGTAAAGGDVGFAVRRQALRELVLIRGSTRPALRLLVCALGGSRERMDAGWEDGDKRLEGLAVKGQMSRQLLGAGVGPLLGPGALRALFDNLDQNELMGYDLFTTTYQPSLRRTDACLVFHHGLADHSERHGEVLAHLCASLGMPVYTYDAHGHGRSGPHDPVGRALIRSYRHIIDDLLDFTRIFVAEAEDADTDLGVEAEGEAEGEGEASPAGPAPPARQGNGDDGNVRQFGQQQQQQRRRRRRKLRAFVLGYSMGGLATTLAVAETCPTHAATASTTTAIAVAAAATGSSLFEGLMLTSCLTDPLYGNHPVLRMVKVAYVTALSWLAPAVPMFKRNPVESGIRDPAAVAAMAEDTLWYRGRFKVATIASLLAGCARLRRTARRLTAVPLYVQHATVDMSCSLPSMHA